MLAACRVEDVRPPAFLNQLCSSSTSRRCPATARHSTRRQCDRRRDTKSVSRVSPDDPAAPILSMIVHRRRSETLTLKGICAELKLDPPVAREKLRAAIREPKKYHLAKAHKPRQPWQWAKGSPAEKEARAALSA